ncbi:hypothetical protein ACFW9N_21420 [Streptomyces sp. NPDC059496]|uniref:hypothetical protein n=1 Tax=Streptomyces sp. NPDC059496 TaxID=3346851 RepID=UPI0036980043
MCGASRWIASSRWNRSRAGNAAGSDERLALARTAGEWVNAHVGPEIHDRHSVTFSPGNARRRLRGTTPTRHTDHDRVRREPDDSDPRWPLRIGHAEGGGYPVEDPAAEVDAGDGTARVSGEEAALSP